ncbi:MAG: cobalt ABC transporter ATP-binding protein [Candidatus Hydrogenedentota bacterium]
MTKPILELDNLSFAYDADRPVLQAVSLAVQPGERIGLIGTNGSGKTTLLQLIVGLLRPTAGTIRAFGAVRQREADFRDVRRRAGLLFQDSDDQLFCPTVYEDVAFGPINLGKSPDETKAVVQSTLEQLDLAGYEDRITYKLSHGEKRRVALATILAMEPDLLLLDEPTTALDESHEMRLVSTLRSLPQAMIIVSHNRPFLDMIAHRTATLKSGVLTEDPGRWAGRSHSCPE